MAREQHDREDLLREATALVERVELRVEGFDDAIIVGFRRGGEASVFFGAEPVYQFNARNALRRAFMGGKLVKAEAGRLVQLERRHTATQVELVRGELGETQTSLLADCRQRLSRLAAQLDGRFYQVVGEVPAGGDIVLRVRQWLAVLPPTIAVAERPNVSG
jgi:hypothetical protein